MASALPTAHTGSATARRRRTRHQAPRPTAHDPAPPRPRPPRQPLRPRRQQPSPPPTTARDGDAQQLSRRKNRKKTEKKISHTPFILPFGACSAHRSIAGKVCCSRRQRQMATKTTTGAFATITANKPTRSLVTRKKKNFAALLHQTSGILLIIILLSPRCHFFFFFAASPASCNQVALPTSYATTVEGNDEARALFTMAAHIPAGWLGWACWRQACCRLLFPAGAANPWWRGGEQLQIRALRNLTRCLPPPGALPSFFFCIIPLDEKDFLAPLVRTLDILFYLSLFFSFACSRSFNTLFLHFVFFSAL